MECPQCVTENNIMFKEKGYGRSCILPFVECPKHGPLKNTTAKYLHQHEQKSEENYLIQLHLNLPPYNKMEKLQAINAIRRHCGFL